LEIDMKLSSPYGPGMPVKLPPETISSQTSKASGKAKARYPHSPLGTSQANSTAGKAQKRALTPGTSPTGS
jgi:hypothetical protein